MAVYKKNALKKVSAKKKKQFFRMRAGYVVVPSLVIGILLSIALVLDTHHKTAVLAASTKATLTACSGKVTGANCSFSAPHGTVVGTCQTSSGQNASVCAPSVGGEKHRTPLLPN